MPTKMHHIALEVSDAAKSAEFYCGLLGFTKQAEYSFPERGRTIVFLELGDVCIELLADAGTEAFVTPPALQVGYKHLCLLTEDVNGDCERLRAAGVTITLEPFDTPLKSRICFVEDPDGIPLELWQETAG